MSEQDNELQETLNPDEETILDTEIEPEEVDVEALKQQAAKAEEYKKFADRTVAENKELKQKLKTTNQSSAELPIDDRFERLELKTEGYSSDEVDFLMQNGGKQALQNSIVMAGIQAIRQKEKSKNATPTGTGRSPIYQRHTEKDLMNMPLAELEKIIPQ